MTTPYFTRTTPAQLRFVGKIEAASNRDGLSHLGLPIQAPHRPRKKLACPAKTGNLPSNQGMIPTPVFGQDHAQTTKA
jgi:hypothetical protein